MPKYDANKGKGLDDGHSYYESVQNNCKTRLSKKRRAEGMGGIGSGPGLPSDFHVRVSVQ